MYFITIESFVFSGLSRTVVIRTNAAAFIKFLFEGSVYCKPCNNNCEFIVSFKRQFNQNNQPQKTKNKLNCPKGTKQPNKKKSPAGHAPIELSRFLSNFVRTNTENN